jgi:hypothetical protein
VKLIISFQYEGKFVVNVEGKMSTSREIQVGVPQGFVFSPKLYIMYIIDTPKTPGVYLALLAGNTFLYARDRKEGYVLRKLERSINSIETWYKRWNIKINEERIQAI